MGQKSYILLEPPPPSCRTYRLTGRCRVDESIATPPKEKNAGPLGNKEGPDRKPHQAIKPPERSLRRLQLL